jgi:hypothetical protein
MLELEVIIVHQSRLMAPPPLEREKPSSGIGMRPLEVKRVYASSIVA